jgi:solute carrier family 35 protein F1/2
MPSSIIDTKQEPEAQVQMAQVPESITPRPPIQYDSPKAFFSSVWRRWASVWTRRFALSLLAGQVVSLCITCTTVTTTELVMRNWALPTTQTFFLYFSLFCVYTPYTIYQYGLKGWAKMIWKDGWKYFILAACDVEGNFTVVKAYQYTDLLSCMLLDAWAIPVCLFFCWVYMRTKYHWTQILGVLVCLVGLGMTVSSDFITDKNWPALNKGKGDAFMILGATLYGFTNATEEFFVRKSPLYEVVGQLGMWGTLINGIQAASLEHDGMTTASWNGATIGLLIAYTAAMFILYTVAPLLYRMASSGYYNISLLTSDFYGLLFGLFLFHYSPYWLYFPSFAVVISGLIIYFWHATPESQGKVDPRAPSYVNRRRGGLQDLENSAETGSGEAEAGVPTLPSYSYDGPISEAEDHVKR